jgi:putative ABC transport system permease protein
MIRNYLTIAWRNLTRNKVFTAVNILGLSVGLTVCMLLSLYIWHESHYDDYHDNGDRLYQVGSVEISRGERNRFHGTGHALAALLKDNFPEVASTARVSKLLSDDKSLLQYTAPDGVVKGFNEEKGYVADSGFFKLFKYDFVEGNATTAISGPNSIVINTDIARKLFGNQPALGKLIHLASNFDGEMNCVVTGVFKPIDQPSQIDGRFFVSMYGGSVGQFIKTYTNMASNIFMNTYVLLKPGSNPASMEKKFHGFVESYMGKDLKAQNQDRDYFLVKVKDIHLHANMEYGDITPLGSLTYLYILGSIALFTLLIACINFMNLATARSTKRAAEVGVRKTLGAGRLSLIRQFLGESIIMSFIAFLLALILTWILLPVFSQISGTSIHPGRAALTTLGITFLALALLTGLFAGSYPALYLSSFQPVKVLKGKSISNSMAVASLRKGLVVFQFCISIILIVAAIIISKQMYYMRNADLGFNKDQQLLIPLRTAAARKNYMALKQEIQKDPGIVSVSGCDNYPGFVGNNWSYYADGKAPSDNHNINTSMVDFEYLKTLGIKAIAGHVFTQDIPSDSVYGIVVNEEAVRRLGLTPEKSIGVFIHAIAPSTDKFQIVGVVKDFHFEGLQQKIGAILFMVASDPQYFYAIAHIQAGQIKPAMDALRATWKSVNPSEPFEYDFLDERFQEQYDQDNRLSAIVGYATAIAIFISCLGLFGLAAFSAEQRSKEIGIRKVLGASTAHLVSLLSVDFLKLVGIAILIGAPIGWWATNRWLREFAYKTSVSWWIFGLAAILALVIAFVTISLQAFRTATANPVKSLKEE